MATIFKKLTTTLPSGTNTHTFTDALINDNSVIEVYFDNDDIYPTNVSQNGNSVTVEIAPHTSSVKCAITINNANSMTDEKGDNVTVIPDLLTGTKIADVIINNTSTPIYAPSGGVGTITTDDVTEEYSNPISGEIETLTQKQINNQFRAKPYMEVEPILTDGTRIARVGTTTPSGVAKQFYLYAPQGSGGTSAEDISFESSDIESTNVQDAIEEVFQYANNGKSSIASAIVGKGGTATSSDTFNELASAISNLPSGTPIGNPLDCHLLPIDRLAFYDPVNKTTETNRVCAFYKRRSLVGQHRIHVIIIKKSDRAIEIVKFGTIKSNYTSQGLAINTNVGSGYQVYGNSGNTGTYPDRDELVLGIGTGEYQNLNDYLNDFEFYVWESD